MAREQRIDSTRNPRVTDWKTLGHRDGRVQQRVFLAEGPHLIEEALTGRYCAPTTLLVSDDFDLSSIRGADKIDKVTMPPNVFAAISDAKSPQGIAALCALPDEDLQPALGRWLLADDVQDPGHVGTLMRTAHAAGWSGVVFGPSSADPFSPKAVRASQGAVFHVPAFRAEIDHWASELRHLGCRILASVVRDGVDYRKVAGEGNLALLLGNEARGLSEQLIAASDEHITIPLPGGAESLSLPVAAGIMIFALESA